MNDQSAQLVQLWKERLSSDSKWHGYETLLETASRNEPMALVFCTLLPLMGCCGLAIVRTVAFVDF